MSKILADLEWEQVPEGELRGTGEELDDPRWASAVCSEWMQTEDLRESSNHRS